MPLSATPKPSPSKVVNDLLAEHPDAASMLAEASHWEALAIQSAAMTHQACHDVRSARRRSEDLKHRLDPRNRRPVNAHVGLGLLALIAVCLFMVDLVEMTGVMGAAATRPLAMCATATWLLAAWRGALAGREGHRRLRILVITGTAALSLMVLLTHVLPSFTDRALRMHHVASSAVAMVLINSLAVGASALISRIEPVTVAVARLRWGRAQARHRMALRQERRDAEAASAAKEAWLGLVRAQATARTTTDEGAATKSLEQTLSVAAALHAIGCGVANRELGHES